MRKISYPDPKIGATILALISFLAVPCFSAPGPISEPTFEVTVEENLMIPMRDGTRLAADIYKPVGAGPSPIILQRTPLQQNWTGLWSSWRMITPPGGMWWYFRTREDVLLQKGSFETIWMTDGENGKTVTIPSNGWQSSPGPTAKQEPSVIPIPEPFNT